MSISGRGETSKRVHAAFNALRPEQPAELPVGNSVAEMPPHQDVEAYHDSKRISASRVALKSFTSQWYVMPGLHKLNNGAREAAVAD